MQTHQCSDRQWFVRWTLLPLLCPPCGALMLLHVFPDWCNPSGLKRQFQWPCVFNEERYHSILGFYFKFCHGFYNSLKLTETVVVKWKRAHCPQGHVLFCSIDLCIRLAFEHCKNARNQYSKWASLQYSTSIFILFSIFYSQCQNVSVWVSDGTI